MKILYPNSNNSFVGKNNNYFQTIKLFILRVCFVNLKSRLVIFVCLPKTKNLIIKSIDYELLSFRRGDRIRTCDPLLPKQMRYRTALRPEKGRRGRVMNLLSYILEIQFIIKMSMP